MGDYPHCQSGYKFFGGRRGSASSEECSFKKVSRPMDLQVISPTVLMTSIPLIVYYVLKYGMVYYILVYWNVDDYGARRC